MFTNSLLYILYYCPQECILSIAILAAVNFVLYGTDERRLTYFYLLIFIALIIVDIKIIISSEKAKMFTGGSCSYGINPFLHIIKKLLNIL